MIGDPDAGAVLWILDGGVDGGVDVRVTGVDGGFTFTPDGLQFERPALLFVPHAPTLRADAGYAVFEATLTSADGGVEAIPVHRAVVAGHDGPATGVVVLQVPHFSGAEVQPEQVRSRGTLTLEPEPGRESFSKPKGEPWAGRLALDAPTAGGTPLVGWVYVTTSPLLALGATAPSFGAPRMINLGTTPQVEIPVDLECTGVGYAFVTASAVSMDGKASITVTKSGTCTARAVVEAFSVTARLDPPGLAQAYLALRDYAVPAPQLPRLDPFEFQKAQVRAAEAGLVAAREAAARPRPVSAWAVECTEDCKSGRTFDGRFTLNNLQAMPRTGTVTIDTSDSCMSIRDQLPPNKLRLPINVASNASFDATFRYECERTCVAALVAEVVLEGQTVKTERQLVDCELYRDAVMLSDNRRLTRNGAGWSVMNPGVTANVIHASPAVTQGIHAQGSSAFYAQVASFTSTQGLTPLTLRSSLQTATATFTNGRYALSGLVASAAFAATDTFTVEHQPMSGAPVTVTVAAPPVLDGTQVLGPRAGLNTEVRLPDTAFDVLSINVVAGPPGQPASQYGVLREVAKADMVLTGGTRSTALLDGRTQGVLTDLGWTVSTIYFAAYRVTSGQAFFPGQRDVPVQAGRMFQVTAADLAP